MEAMIEQLMERLRKEKKMTDKQQRELERLNKEIIQLEGVVHHKTQTIYELEIKIINLERKYGQKQEQHAMKYRSQRLENSLK